MTDGVVETEHDFRCVVHGKTIVLPKKTGLAYVEGYPDDLLIKHLDSANPIVLAALGELRAVYNGWRFISQYRGFCR